MGAPAFGTIGTKSVSASAASLTPAMPASIAAGDTLIAWVTINATGKTVGTPAGWTAGGSLNANNMSGAWFWKDAVGSDTSPTLSWTGAAACQAQVLRFTGSGTPATPTGATNSASANTSTTLTAAGIVTTAANSLIVYLLATATSQTIPTPTDYTLIQAAASADGSTCLVDGAVGASGATSEAISDTVTSSDWISFGLELIGSGTAATGNIRASQSAQETLETASATANIRASQVAQQALETASATANVRASQVAIQVLRTQPKSATPTGIIKPELSVLQRGHPLAQGLIMAWLFDELNLLTTLLNIDKGVFEKISNTSVSATAGTVQWLSNSLAIQQGAPNGSAIDYRSSGQVDTNIWTPVEGLKQITIATRCNNYSATTANGGWVLSKGGTPELGLSNLTDGKTYFYFNSNPITSAVGAVPNQTWGDLFATYDGANQRIFWNAAQIASGALASNTSPVTGNHLLFGDRGNASANYDIDCIMIWNRALSQQEIGQWSFDPYAMFRMRTINVYKVSPIVFDVSGLVEIEW